MIRIPTPQKKELTTNPYDVLLYLKSALGILMDVVRNFQVNDQYLERHCCFSFVLTHSQRLTGYEIVLKYITKNTGERTNDIT